MGAAEARYESRDKSILLPYFRRYLWDPMGGLVPDWFAPNTLTILGCLCALGGLWSALLIDPSHPRLYLIPAAMLFLYTTFDNMDGAHARRTGQSTPLGEFVDHWLDTLNAAFASFAVGHALGLPEWLIVSVVAAGILAMFATYWEQRVTGVIQLGRVGNLEALVLLVILLVLVAFGGQGVSEIPVLGVPSGLFFGGAYALGSVVISIGCFVRVKDQRSSWIAPVLALAAAAIWFIAGSPGYLAIGLILAAGNAIFSGRVLAARLLQPRGQLFEVLIGAALVLGCGASLAFGLAPAVQGMLAGTIAGCMCLLVVYDFCRFVHGLRHHLRRDELLGRIFVRGPVEA